MKHLLGAALTTCVFVSFCSEAAAQASTLPPHGSVTADTGYTVTRVYSPSAYTDTTQNIQVNFTIAPTSANAGAIQLPYQTETIELGVRDPNQSSNSNGPINYVQGTRTLVSPSTCTRSGIDNRTLNCNATINFPASLRNGDNHLIYIRYMATSVYSGNTSLNWTGYYTLATQLGCAPAPACFTMGQTTPTTSTGWPTNTETNPLMPDFVDGNGSFIFDLDFNGMVNIPPECADPLDPGYDPFLCEDVCTIEPWTDTCMGPSSTFFIDPPIATGYDYTITGSHFMSVKAPSLSAVNDPDGYLLSYLNAGVPASQNLLPGQSFNFPTSVGDFKITGILPSLALDPSDVALFPTGISVTGIPQQGLPEVRITQTPITAPSVPSIPLANAGPDDSVTAPGNVKLDGTASTHPQGGSLTYNWKQVAGPTVALLNPQSARPNFWTLYVTTPTTVSFELQVEDTNGNQSVVDQVDILINPSPRMPQCTAWNRDTLVASLSAYPEGSGYSVTHNINGQVKTDLQNLANDLAAQHANFGRLEIKSYISDVGSAASPILHGNSAASMSPQAVDFTSPATPSATPFWTGGHFSADNWYRWDTKINLWRANGYSLDGVSFGDDCVYQTVFFKIDGTDGTLQARTHNGFRLRNLRPKGQLNFGDVKKPLGIPKLLARKLKPLGVRGAFKTPLTPEKPKTDPSEGLQIKKDQRVIRKFRPRER